MSAGNEVESWRGIRRDESQNRQDAPDRELTAEGYWIIHPIAAWSAQQVIDFVRDRGLPLNPLYRQGMRRVGCMPCINCAKDELLEIWQRWPAYIDVVRQWEELVCLAAKRGWTTFFCDSLLEGETDADIFQRLKIDERVKWAKTARGGRQFDFLRAMGTPACSSQYGLCE
jgi:3'-phosphoadenosine 5'-phosphosulfate sulfotransferase (PAPS reductase)/FAD synthetase